MSEFHTLRAMPETGASSATPLPAILAGAPLPVRQPKEHKSRYHFRHTVQRLLDRNQGNVEKWLLQVAEGTPAVVDATTGVVQSGLAPDPAKALTLMATFAEFAAPKLSRQELVGDPDAPLQVAQIDARKLTTEQLRALATIELPADSVREIPDDPADEFC